MGEQAISRTGGVSSPPLVGPPNRRWAACSTPPSGTPRAWGGGRAATLPIVTQYRPGLSEIRPPRLQRVFVRFPRPTVGDVAAAVRREAAKQEIVASLGDAATVAIAVGSRGIAGIDCIVRALVEELVTEVEGFAGTDGYHDDLTVVSIRVLPE